MREQVSGSAGHRQSERFVANALLGVQQPSGAGIEDVQHTAAAHTLDLRLAADEHSSGGQREQLKRGTAGGAKQ